MQQDDKARAFSALHLRALPLRLYNAWDAGSAKAIAAAGAKAIATSSWAVAEAQGYRDGEGLPLEFALQIIRGVVGAVDLPVTADFEGGYSEDDGLLAENVARLIDVGVVGLNFEDRIVKGTDLYETGRQAQRIAAIRDAAERKRVPLYINARTDLFLGRAGDPAASIQAAIDRAKAYADAGASGFFVPGLRNDVLIGQICEAVTLPVNVMVVEGISPAARLADLGVSRISYGNIPYVRAMQALRESAMGAL